MLRFRREALPRPNAVADQLQRTLGRVRRILLANRTRRGIAGVGEHLLTLRLTLGVHRGEVLHVNEHLPADLHELRDGELLRFTQLIRDA